MDSTDRPPSQTSDCSSVLDLSCTYNLSQTTWPHEPSPRSYEEDVCSTLTSASSLPSLQNTGSRTNSCEGNEELLLEEDEKSQYMPRSSDAFRVTQQRASTLNSQKVESKQGLNDVQIQASLDAFYEQSSWRGKYDTFSDQLSEKISDLSRKQHLYALRSFQLGKIVLNQEGEKVLQNRSSENVFSRENTKNGEPVPGLSKDVVRFILDKTSPSQN
ncbi:shieldin complex subunit 1-like [Bufo gargarizans]|uniref:shieldin complex subunit 1-like n=1 Tax=Bufo gargarizans TaxID=30331 RepID=UPI001CF13922|nr:shieldin complex subunit 1-like [Bufo gargarizans]XP_044146608.1 shieldin complex subunit 1-like [Bufo gargarizans]XP_044146609.1 shieldin complex subunit 1-like [Bufo gargarizans]